MTSSRMALLAEPERLRGALVPLRRRLLSRLRRPASATELARELDLSRQKVNYHLHKLEDAGLIELVEQRRRRGCVERVMQARADAYVIDPSLMSGPNEPSTEPLAEPSAEASAEPRTEVAAAPGDLPRDRTGAGDRHAADHLVAVASQVVRDVTRMQEAADRAGRRLLTFTLETEVRLGAPGDLHRLTEALAEAVATVVADFDTPDGRVYRLVGGGHPAPSRPHHTERRSHDRPHRPARD